ncbi:hypothetical protein SAMN05421690_100521 [Nitrosomonas sp. Nm51]|uniref:hypothetical protein n=1 Tax=Nitrosomonas sp. Nm51 TaxID=133720 RepID=UPI0008BC3467|nr:hypothetical protein [Nitrosomonas sp. Nm51]SEQ98757.1 hypothetical protein SAMN05421690_100521 [Nitrosomonas sp. Nm51]
MTTLSVDKAERACDLTQVKDCNITRSCAIPAMLMLSGDGKILYVNKEAEKLLNFPAKQRHKLHISKVILALGKVDLLEKSKDRVNTFLRFLSRIGYRFKLCSFNGKRFTGELFFNDIDLDGCHNVVVLIYPDARASSNM